MTFASVLGVPKYINDVSVNEQPIFTIQYCKNDSSAPDSFFICFTLLNSVDGAQIGVGSDNGLYYRFKANGAWLSWKKAASV